VKLNYQSNFEGENGAESLGFDAGKSVICRNSITDFLELGDWYLELVAEDCNPKSEINCRILGFNCSRIWL